MRASWASSERWHEWGAICTRWIGIMRVGTTGCAPRPGALDSPSVRRRFLTSVLLTASLGCASTGAPSGPREAPASSGHGYALLHEILGQERQVSKLLIIKEERDALESVIDAIAETC